MPLGQDLASGRFGRGLACPLTVLSAVVAVFMAACTPGAPAPRETFYRLNVEPAAQKALSPALPGVLEVGRVEAEGVLSDRALAYQSGTNALQRYRYESWSDPPGLMLQDAIAGTLRAANVAQSVVTPDLRVPPDWTMRTRLKRFEQIAGERRVAVEMEVAVVNARNGQLLLQKAYAAYHAADGESPEAAVAALGLAMSDVLTNLVADLSQVKVPAQVRP